MTRHFYSSFEDSCSKEICQWGATYLGWPGGYPFQPPPRIRGYDSFDPVIGSGSFKKLYPLLSSDGKLYVKSDTWYPFANSGDSINYRYAIPDMSFKDVDFTNYTKDTFRPVENSSITWYGIDDNGDLYTWGEKPQWLGGHNKVFYPRVLLDCQIEKIVPIHTNTPYADGIRRPETLSFSITKNYEQDPGSGFDIDFDIEYSLATDIITSELVIVTGTGLTNNYYLDIIPIGNNIERGKAKINGIFYYEIKDIQILNSGTNYQNLNIICSADARGLSAKINTTLFNGSIDNITITDPGLYETIPNYTIVGDGANADIALIWEAILVDIKTITPGAYSSNTVELIIQNYLNNEFSQTIVSTEYMQQYMRGHICDWQIISGGNGYTADFGNPLKLIVKAADIGDLPSPIAEFDIILSSGLPVGIDTYRDGRGELLNPSSWDIGYYPEAPYSDSYFVFTGLFLGYPHIDTDGTIIDFNTQNKFFDPTIREDDDYTRFPNRTIKGFETDFAVSGASYVNIYWDDEIIGHINYNDLESQYYRETEITFPWVTNGEEYAYIHLYNDSIGSETFSTSSFTGCNLIPCGFNSPDKSQYPYGIIISDITYPGDSPRFSLKDASIGQFSLNYYTLSEAEILYGPSKAKNFILKPLKVFNPLPTAFTYTIFTYDINSDPVFNNLKDFVYPQTIIDTILEIVNSAGVWGECDKTPIYDFEFYYCIYAGDYEGVPQYVTSEDMITYTSPFYLFLPPDIEGCSDCQIYRKPPYTDCTTDFYENPPPLTSKFGNCYPISGYSVANLYNSYYNVNGSTTIIHLPMCGGPLNKPRGPFDPYIDPCENFPYNCWDSTYRQPSGDIYFISNYNTIENSYPFYRTPPQSFEPDELDIVYKGSNDNFIIDYSYIRGSGNNIKVQFSINNSQVPMRSAPLIKASTYPIYPKIYSSAGNWKSVVATENKVYLTNDSDELYTFGQNILVNQLLPETKLEPSLEYTTISPIKIWKKENSVFCIDTNNNLRDISPNDNSLGYRSGIVIEENINPTQTNGITILDTPNTNNIVLFEQNLDKNYDVIFNTDTYAISGLYRQIIYPNFKINYDLSNFTNSHEDFPGIPSYRLNVPTAADAILDGRLISIAIENSGYGYQQPPEIHIAGNATATAIIQGPIGRINIIDGGENYEYPPSIVFNGDGIPPILGEIVIKDGKIIDIPILHGGKYRVLPSIYLVGEKFINNDGRSAVLSPILNGSVIYANITNSGSNYQYPPDIVIESPDSSYLRLMNGSITRKDYDNLPHIAKAQCSIKGLITNLNNFSSNNTILMNYYNNWNPNFATNEYHYSRPIMSISGAHVTPTRMQSLRRTGIFLTDSDLNTEYYDIDFTDENFTFGGIRYKDPNPIRGFDNVLPIDVTNQFDIDTSNIIVGAHKLKYLNFGFGVYDGFVFRDNKWFKRLTYNTINIPCYINDKIFYLSDIRWSGIPDISMIDLVGKDADIQVELNGDNKISSVYFNNEGNGLYTDQAIISISGDILFSQANITGIIDINNNSGIKNIIILDEGYGYDRYNTDIIIDHNTGSGLKIKLHYYDSVIPSGIAGISIIDSGYNYSYFPTITLINKNNIFRNELIKNINLSLRKVTGRLNYENIGGIISYYAYNLEYILNYPNQIISLPNQVDSYGRKKIIYETLSQDSIYGNRYGDEIFLYSYRHNGIDSVQMYFDPAANTLVTQPPTISAISQIFGNTLPPCSPQGSMGYSFDAIKLTTEMTDNSGIILALYNY